MNARKHKENLFECQRRKGKLSKNKTIQILPNKNWKYFKPRLLKSVSKRPKNSPTEDIRNDIYSQMLTIYFQKTLKV